MVFSPSALAASSRCRPSTSTKRAPSTLTRIGNCRPLSRMLAAISSTRSSDHSDRAKHGDTRALLQVDATNSSAATHVVST